MNERLLSLSEEIDKVIISLNPTALVLEKIFVGNNVQAALKLGQARGVIMLAAARHRLLFYEYSPNEIKKAVVGKGHATKDQVQFMVKSLLGLSSLPPPDAADALAIAICHMQKSVSLERCKSI